MRILIFTLVLCGCSFGPDYRLPEIEMPEDWKTPTCDCPSTPCVDHWWELFDDPLLNDLEAEAIENSPTLVLAMEKVAEARAMAGVSRADLFPQITLNPSYSQTDLLFKIYLPGTVFPGITPLQAPFRANEFLYSLPLNVSYQMDLWGKYSGQYESAWDTMEAQAEALRTALLTLTTDLAMSYFQVRSLDAQLDSLQQSIDLRRQGLTLAQSRYKKGLVNEIEATTAEATLASLEADYDDLMRQRILQENAVAVLVGMAASDFCLPSLPLTHLPPCVPAGLPSDVLLQRPDVAEAERNMAAEHALIGVAYANFFPSIDLTMTLGFVSPTLHDFVSWISRYWYWSAKGAQTVLDFGRNGSNLDAAWARFRQASSSYQNTILIAFREVEDALNNLEMQAKQSKSLEKMTDATTKTASLSQNRYQKGLVNFTEVINNQSIALDSQRSLRSLLGVRYLSTVQLIKALGGDWHGTCTSLTSVKETKG